MKRALIIVSAIILGLWAFLFFVVKIGETAHILLAVTGVILLFLYSMRRVFV